MSPTTSPSRTAAAATTGSARASAVLVVGDRAAASSRALAACLRTGGHPVAEIDGADPAAVDAASVAELVVLDASTLDADAVRTVADAARTASVPVLHVAEQARAAGTATKADAWVAHPAAEPELLATAGTLLRLRRAERELRRKTARLRETQAATADLARAGSFDAVARALHLHAASALGASVAVLYRLGDARQAEDPTSLHAPAIDRHGGLEHAAASCRELPLHRDTGVTQAVRFSEAVWVADVAAQGASARLVLHDADLGSWAALPLLAGERAEIGRAHV